ncbi:Uncharacterised protein [Nocardia brasiliensis]|nr:Uncharacterised protein [Nocardia brasiliensis]
MRQSNLSTFTRRNKYNFLIFLISSNPHHVTWVCKRHALQEIPARIGGYKLAIPPPLHEPQQLHPAYTPMNLICACPHQTIIFGNPEKISLAMDAFDLLNNSPKNFTLA